MVDLSTAPSHHLAAQLLKAEEAQGGRAVYEARCCWGLIPKRWLRCQSRGSAQIDVFSRFAFPAVFLLFNAYYWTAYTSGEGDYHSGG